MRRLDTIDLRLLRVFITLVESGGFAGAQIALDLSPSTLSTHLADLETRIGGPLCTRGRKTFRLTDLGHATLEAARTLFADIDDFRLRIGAANGRLTGRLRLGIVDGVITSRELGLQHVIDRMMAPDADIVLDVIQAQPLELEQAVVEGRRDVVIGPFSQRAPGITYKPLLRESHRLFCGQTHPLFATPDAAIDHALIERAKPSVRAYRHMDDLYRIGHRKAAASVMQMEAQAMLILSGHFIGFLPCHIAAPFVSRGDMRAIKPKVFAFESQHFVAYRRDADKTAVVQAFLKALLDAAATDPRGPEIDPAATTGEPN